MRSDTEVRKEIFWVDDDIKTFVRSYYEELTDAGYKISKFEEPDSALDNFKDHHKEFSCAIIDLMLPTGKTFTADETELGTRTGKSLINKLRETSSQIPIIILTLVDDAEVVDWATQEGITYMTKPDTLPKDLLNKVNELVKKPQKVDESRTDKNLNQE